MDNKLTLQLLLPVQRELEEIAQIYMELAGPESARRITDRIYTALDKLLTFPNMDVSCRDKRLAADGYRMLICDNYLCFYRLIGDTIFVYHIADGRANYPKLFSDLY